MVSSLAVSGRTTSTSDIAGAGLKKWMPQTRRVARSPSRARRPAGSRCSWRGSRRASRPRSSSRKTALLHREVLDDRLDDEVAVGEVLELAWSPRRARMASARRVALALLDLLGERLRRRRPASRRRSLGRDRTMTSAPVAAATSAMPLPMIPEPTTPTFWKPICEDYFGTLEAPDAKLTNGCLNVRGRIARRAERVTSRRTSCSSSTKRPTSSSFRRPRRSRGSPRPRLTHGTAFEKLRRARRSTDGHRIARRRRAVLRDASERSRRGGPLRRFAAARDDRVWRANAFGDAINAASTLIAVGAVASVLGEVDDRSAWWCADDGTRISKRRGAVYAVQRRADVANAHAVGRRELVVIGPSGIVGHDGASGA